MHIEQKKKHKFDYRIDDIPSKATEQAVGLNLPPVGASILNLTTWPASPADSPDLLKKK